MGTRRGLAPLVIAAGAVALVAVRRRGKAARSATPALLPAPVAPPVAAASPAPVAPPAPVPAASFATADAAPAAASPAPAGAPATPAPPAELPADPHPRDPSRTRDLALGYVSIPAVDDAHREDLRRQVKHIRRACEALELSLIDLIPDTESDDVTASERPGIRRILRRLDRGDASCLVTTTVERLASSAEEWGQLLTRLDAEGVRLVVVDDALDTGLDGGREDAWALIGQEAPGTR